MHLFITPYLGIVQIPCSLVLQPLPLKTFGLKLELHALTKLKQLAVFHVRAVVYTWLILTCPPPSPGPPGAHTHNNLQTVQNHPDGLDWPLHLASQLGIEGSIMFTHLDLLQPTRMGGWEWRRSEELGSRERYREMDVEAVKE